MAERKKERSILTKIMAVVLLGSVMGASFVGFIFYLAMTSNGVDENTALKYSILSAIFMELSWIIGPILGIRIMIDKMILSRLREITDLMNKVSMGEVDVSVDTSGDDEISELADAFERMRLSIKALYKRLA